MDNSNFVIRNLLAKHRSFCSLINFFAMNNSTRQTGRRSELWYPLARHLKPRPNIATFQCNISQHCWVQHVACVCPSCCDVLRHVATCWMLLAQIWKWSTFSWNICECCMMLWSFDQVRATMLGLGMRTSSIFNSQHVATSCNRVAKRVQHVAPNNVAMCCV